MVIKAANKFRDKTGRPNELWQTDFTCLKVIGWDWLYLSTILDDYSRGRHATRSQLAVNDKAFAKQRSELLLYVAPSHATGRTLVLHFGRTQVLTSA